MKKKLFFLLFTCIITLAMQDSQRSKTHDHDAAYIRAQVIERLIGLPIPTTIAIEIKFSEEHTFETGELVAIPSSTTLDTKNSTQETYGKISSIKNNELTILYKPLQSPHFIEFTTPRRRLIGKIPSEILHNVLKTLDSNKP